MAELVVGIRRLLFTRLKMLGKRRSGGFGGSMVSVQKVCES